MKFKIITLNDIRNHIFQLHPKSYFSITFKIISFNEVTSHEYLIIIWLFIINKTNYKLCTWIIKTSTERVIVNGFVDISFFMFIFKKKITPRLYIVLLDCFSFSSIFLLFEMTVSLNIIFSLFLFLLIIFNII